MSVLSVSITLPIAVITCATLLAGQVVAAEQPIRIQLLTDQVDILVTSSIVTPTHWFIPKDGVATPARHVTQGYIFYSYAWQATATRLSHLSIGQELTIHFPSARPKTFVIHNLFSVGAKSDDHSVLANDADTLLIYSSKGFADRDQLVILAKEQPTAEVSSL